MCITKNPMPCCQLTLDPNLSSFAGPPPLMTPFQRCPCPPECTLSPTVIRGIATCTPLHLCPMWRPLGYPPFAPLPLETSTLTLFRPVGPPPLPLALSPTAVSGIATYTPLDLCPSGNPLAHCPRNPVP